MEATSKAIETLWDYQDRYPVEYPEQLTAAAKGAAQMVALLRRFPHLQELSPGTLAVHESQVSTLTQARRLCR